MNGTGKRWQFIPQAARLGSRAACALLEGSRAHASVSSHVGRCLVGMCEVGGGPSLEMASPCAAALISLVTLSGCLTA